MSVTIKYLLVTSQCMMVTVQYMLVTIKCMMVTIQYLLVTSQCMMVTFQYQVSAGNKSVSVGNNTVRLYLVSPVTSLQRIEILMTM